MIKIKDINFEISGLLGLGSRFEGHIQFEDVLRIDGIVYGQISCKNKKPSMVIITEMAEVEADIVADVVVISGLVSGNVKAIQRMELKAPGRFEGLVYTSDLSIEDGSLFQGECVMIRHLSDDDKKAIKLEGFYEIHNNRIAPPKKKTL